MRRNQSKNDSRSIFFDRFSTIATYDFCCILILIAMPPIHILADYPLGVWIENAPLVILPMPNKKRGSTLLFNGYQYTKEACFKTSTNWLCMGYVESDDQIKKCKARCVTKIDNSIKLGNHHHIHPPQ